MAKTEKQTSEALLAAILEEIKNLHTTIGNGLLALQKAALADKVISTPDEPGVDIVEKPETDLAMEVSKDISTWIEEHPGCTAADVMKEHHISINRATAAVKKYGKPAPKKETKAPEEKKITVEMLRAKISEFAERFSMNEALAVNEQFGGSRKVSGIPEVAYEKVFNAMDERLKKQAEVDGKPAAEAEEKAPTIDDVREVAKPFVDKNGDPAFRALLKAIGKADKISGVDPKFYPALIEALTNA